MSVWGTIFDLEDNPPYVYQGSHVVPSEADARDEGWSLQLAEIPSHITRDGRNDQPEDGAPWPWLRLSLHSEDTVLDRTQVEAMHSALGAWLDQAGDRPSKPCCGMRIGHHPGCAVNQGVEG